MLRRGGLVCRRKSRHCLLRKLRRIVSRIPCRCSREVSESTRTRLAVDHSSRHSHMSRRSVKWLVVSSAERANDEEKELPYGITAVNKGGSCRGLAADEWAGGLLVRTPCLSGGQRHRVRVDVVICSYSCHQSRGHGQESCSERRHCGM